MVKDTFENEMKRFPVKVIRDYIKRDYKKRDACYICGVTENLDLHHLYSISELFHNWCFKNKITDFKNDTIMLQLRMKFAEDCKEELAHENLYTLCEQHHARLHTIFGQRYDTFIAKKVKNWLELQKQKFNKEI